MKALLQTVKNIIKCQISNQLPGGKFWNPSPQLYKEALSCCVENISGERRFGNVDTYTKKAPSASIEKVEARMLFKGNRTDQCLEGQDPQIRKCIIECAAKDTGKNQLKGCSCLRVKR